MHKSTFLLFCFFVVLCLAPNMVLANNGDFSGPVAIGTSYAGIATVPANGLAVQGAVGIGTSNPQFNLHIYNSANQDVIEKVQSTGRGAFFDLDSSNNYDAALGLINGSIIWGFGQTGNVNSLVIMAGGQNSNMIVGSGGVGNAVAAFNTAGNVLIGYNSPASSLPANLLQVNGNVYAAAYNTSSDRNLKSDITPLPSVLALVNSLNPVSFIYKQNILVPGDSNGSPDAVSTTYQFPRGTQVGFIAQDLDAELSDTPFHDGIVHTSDNHAYMTMTPDELIPLLTKAVQELSSRLSADETTIAQLKAQLPTQAK